MKPTKDTEIIRYAAHPTALGLVFAATTDRGICLLQLIPKNGRADSLAELHERHPNATFKRTRRLSLRFFSKSTAG